MTFTTLIFFVFFCVVFGIYWMLGNNLKTQNLFLLLASYFFYGWVNWKLLLLLVSFTFLNFYLSLKLENANSQRAKKIFLNLGILSGIGILFFFKYYDFFLSSFSNALELFGIQFRISTLKIIAPLGVSFYTFKTMGYFLDISNRKIHATSNWLAFFNYLSFFPTVVAGPIDKAEALLPQFEKTRKFDYTLAIDGVRQILWGLFKKVVVADNCATITNPVYNYLEFAPRTALFVTFFLYPIQMYADFSGYSDMAIGLSRMLGFKISKNFNYPLFARSIPDYWRRWHISLTKWFTEHVFIPLTFTFRSYKKAGIIASIFLNFVVVGLWHGANWTYIVFGLFHAVYFIPYILKGSNNKRAKKTGIQKWPRLKEFGDMLLNFVLIAIAFVWFRASSVHQGVQYFKTFWFKLFFNSTQSFQVWEANISLFFPLFFSLFMLIVEWFGRKDEYGIAYVFTAKPKCFKIICYYLLVILIFIFAGPKQQFIYFQF